MSVCSNYNPYSESSHELHNTFTVVSPKNENDVYQKGYLDLRMDKQEPGIFIHVNTALPKVHNIIFLTTNSIH